MSGPLVLEQNLEGNIILHSFDSIFVRSTARLRNVILIAPRIRFEKGFKGEVQAIAHEQITVEENVYLSYPSVLVLNELNTNENQTNSRITIQSKAKVLGGVLLVSQKMEKRRPIQLSMKDALIAGVVYNQGQCEIVGKIAGAIYTSQFFLKIGGGEYINHILDAHISLDLLPKEFVLPRFIETTVHQPIIVSWVKQ